MLVHEEYQYVKFHCFEQAASLAGVQSTCRVQLSGSQAEDRDQEASDVRWPHISRSGVRDLFISLIALMYRPSSRPCPECKHHIYNLQPMRCCDLQGTAALPFWEERQHSGYFLSAPVGQQRQSTNQHRSG